MDDPNRTGFLAVSEFDATHNRQRLKVSSIQVRPLTSGQTSLPPNTACVRVVLGILLACTFSESAKAQGDDALRARDALLSSGLVSLVPRGPSPEGRSLTAEYAGWIYYKVDPWRSNFGVSFTTLDPDRAIGVSVSLAHVAEACIGCPAWVTGAVTVERPLSKVLSLEMRASYGRSPRYPRMSSSALGISAYASAGGEGFGASLAPGLVLAAMSSGTSLSRVVRPTLGGSLRVPILEYVSLYMGAQGGFVEELAPVIGGGLRWRLPPAAGR